MNENNVLKLIETEKIKTGELYRFSTETSDIVGRYEALVEGKYIINNEAKIGYFMGIRELIQATTIDTSPSVTLILPSKIIAVRDVYTGNLVKEV